VDGLWVGGSAAATDFHSIAYQLKLLGFNAVRLPFTFDVLQVGLHAGPLQAGMGCGGCHRDVDGKQRLQTLLGGQ
jgi:hypothetical protein